MQTILGYFSKSKKSFAPEETLRIRISDHCETIGLLNIPRCSTARTPVMLLFHEFGGDAHTGHVSRLAQKLVALGLRTARVVHRQSFHSGAMGDIMAAIEAIHHRWPEAPIGLTGLGLSATTVLNLLGRQPNIGVAYPSLVGALCVCPTLDIEESRRRLSSFEKGYLTKLYSKRGQNGFRQSFIENEQQVVSEGREFRSLQDYYTNCSPTHSVKNIKLPTMILASANDPLNPINTIMKAPFSEAVTLKIESSGGHLGFYSHRKTRFGDHFWLDDIVVNWWLGELKPLLDLSANLPRQQA